MPLLDYYMQDWRKLDFIIAAYSIICGKILIIIDIWKDDIIVSRPINFFPIKLYIHPFSH